MQGGEGLHLDRVLVALVAVGGVLSFAPVLAAAERWTTFQATSLHRGYMPFSFSDPRLFAPRWSLTVPGSGLTVATPTAGRVFFVATGSGQALHAVDGRTGNPIWSQALGPVWKASLPTTAHGLVYIQTEDTTQSWVRAYDQATGQPRFAAPYQSQTFGAAITVMGDRLYVAGDGVFSLDALTGVARFSQTGIPSNDGWAPSVDLGRVVGYLGGSVGPSGLFVLDRADGSSAGFIPDPGYSWRWSMWPSAVAMAGDRAYVTNAYRLIAFDLASGTIAYQVRDAYQGPVTVAGNTLYVPNDRGLAAHDAATGALLWSWPLGIPYDVYGVVASDSHLFLDTSDGVFVLDVATHAVVWSHLSSGILSLSEDTLYVSVYGGGATLMAIGLDWSCLALQPAAIPAARLGSFYDQPLTASGGTPPYYFALGNGTLPAGMAVASSGAIVGTPTEGGIFAFSVTATDAAGCSGSRLYELVVDGTWDFAVAPGPGAANPARIAVFTASGAPAGVAFDAYGTPTYGANVTTGVMRGPPAEDFVTGPGPGPAHPPRVRGFDRTGVPLANLDFYAYGTAQRGVNVSTGSPDLDGWDEILTGPGPALVFGPHVRAFDFDNATLRPIPGLSFFAFGTPRYGVNVAAADVDDDYRAEILAAAGPSPVFAPQIRGFDTAMLTPSPLPGLQFDAFALTGYGARVSGGDVVRYGRDEIAGTPGPGPLHPALVRGFAYDGAAVAPVPGFDVTPFTTMFGASAHLGELALDGRDDVVATAGPSPAADTTVRAYRLAGGRLEAESTPFVAFPGTSYGALAVAAQLGY